MRNCVYRIVNIRNNKLYIGSTIDSERRKLEHFSQLERGKHINNYLQRAYNKDGKDAFVFDVIESELKDDELLKREQHYIDLFNSSNSNFGYNISEYANQPDGRKYTKMYTVKIKEILKQNKLSSSAIALFLCLQIYVERYTNKITMQKGKSISNEELISVIGFSRQKIASLLGELESNSLIKRVGKGRNREIYMNPNLVTAGYEVKQDTYDMFEQ